MPGMAIGGMTGRIGGSGILATPGSKIGRSSVLWPSAVSGPGPGVRPFRSQPLATTHTAIWGVTRDNAGNIIPNCRVQLWRNQSNVFTVLGGPSNLVFVQLRVIAPQPYNANTFPPGNTPAEPGELVEETRSDANGNYIFWSPHVGGPFWLVAWQDQDVGPTFGWSGATDKTIQPDFCPGPPF